LFFILTNSEMSKHLKKFAFCTVFSGLVGLAPSPAHAQLTQSHFNEKDYHKAKRLADSLLIKKNIDVSVALFSDFMSFVHPLEQAPGFPQEIAIAEAPDEVSKDLFFSPKPGVVHVEDEDLVYDYVPRFSDDVLEDRLSCLSGSIPLTFNSQVRGFIDYFAIKRRDYTLRMLSKKNVFFPLFEKYLKEYGVPDELKYLSIVESALNPKARSRVGAMGLWQFMPGTGQMFGLRQNNYVDERMDPEKSTIAACKYLSQLYHYFGQNWELALAAYNSGPGTVQRAIRRSGGKTDFWQIYHLLPAETRSYVPMFTAVTYIMHYAEEHNLIQDQPFYAIPYATVEVDQTLHLKSLAQKLNVCAEDLEELNPELKKGVVPPNTNYQLRIPADRAEFFYQNQMDILASARMFSREVGTKRLGRYSRYSSLQSAESGEPVGELEASTKRTSRATTKTRTTLHTIKRGESLGLIAQRNGVTVKQLRQWNHLPGNKLIAGKKLKIVRTVKVNEPDAEDEQLAYTQPEKEEAAAPAERAVVAPAAKAKKTKAQPKEKEAPAESKASKNDKETGKAKEANKTVTPAKGAAYHKVQNGESLWSLAKKYGTTVEQLKKLNDFKDNKLPSGKQIRVN
jgi:membrane-bound lytic murein transglycosylase D